MGKHFSSQELYKLRNSIPLDVLIKKELNIPSKISEGYFRFLCPLCNEFQTAINTKTNLGRCFRCEKNFNTIDMVMIWQNTGFIDSVKYLKTIRPVQLKSKIFSTAYAASLNSSSLSSNHFLLSLFRCTAVIEAIAIEPFFDQLIPLCF